MYRGEGELIETESEEESEEVLQDFLEIKLPRLEQLEFKDLKLTMITTSSTQNEISSRIFVFKYGRGFRCSWSENALILNSQVINEDIKSEFIECLELPELKMKILNYNSIDDEITVLIDYKPKKIELETSNFLTLGQLSKFSSLTKSEKN